MPLGILPISAVAENYGIDMALILSGLLLAGSLFLLRIWIPELATIDRGHGEDKSATGDSDQDPDTDPAQGSVDRPNPAV